MNRVAKRTWIMGLFLLILLGGTFFFLTEYVEKAASWVTSPGSAHVYNKGNIGCGTIYDREGVVLLDVDAQRSYAEDSKTRKSMLHWLGDRQGFINAGAVTHYAADMAGFDLINGVYAAQGQGGSMTLTLDARIQNRALDALAGRKGTVGVYNYRTGELLCAVTSPNFDPDNVPDIENDPTDTYTGVYLNRFLQSAYVPGSIFKVVTTAAALECIPDIESRTFNCTGELSYGEEAVTCETAHGRQSLKEALAHSCNCAFAQVAKIVGKKNMQKYVAAFEITEPVSFDGVKSAAGNYNIKDTGSVSFAWSAIGQHSDLINPARYLTFMGTVAAGGQGVEPYLVSRVTSGENVTYEAEAKVTERIMSQKTAETVKAYMRNNVSSGYGDENFRGLNVCAKSGTSQLGGGQKSNAMFAGFVADEKYPLAFIVVVENGGYGAATCVPVISAVLNECKTVMDSQ